MGHGRRDLMHRAVSSPRWPTSTGSATIAGAMLSRAQEARVREVLAGHPPGALQTAAGRR